MESRRHAHTNGQTRCRAANLVDQCNVQPTRGECPYSSCRFSARPALLSSHIGDERLNVPVKYISSTTLAKRYGFSSRHWTSLAAAGKLPGAYQPSGTGGKWVFDEAAFRRWWGTSMRRGSQWPVYTAEGKHGGDAPSVKGASTAEAWEQQARRKLKAVLENG